MRRPGEDGRPDRHTTIRISPRHVLAALLAGVAVLTVTNVATQVAKHVYQRDVMLGFVRLFYVDAEANVPTWFSSTQLLLSALALGLIAAAAWRQRRPYAWHWTALAALFAALSLDEAAAIHEITVAPVARALRLGGALTNTAWVIPAVVVLVLLGVASRRFVRDLRPATRRRALVALAVAVAGAVGMELLGGYYSHRHGYENLPYAMIATVEELLEMLGGALFVHAWLSHLAEEGEELRLHVG
jgi:hypothetical protein